MIIFSIPAVSPSLLNEHLPYIISALIIIILINALISYNHMIIKYKILGVHSNGLELKVYVSLLMIG